MSEPTVGSILERMMDERGITAYRVSLLIGVHRNSVRKALNSGGTGLSLDLFRRICAALQISPCDVLDRLPGIQIIDVPDRGRGRPKKESEESKTTEAGAKEKTVGRIPKP